MSRVLNRRLVATGGLLITATLVGCSAPSVVESSSGRTIVVSSQTTDAQEDARADGALEWGDAGCMVIELGDAGETHLLVFPQGTTMEDDEVVLPSGSRIQAGAKVALGGGFHSPESRGRDLSSIPDGCLTEEVFWASGDMAD